MNTSAMAASKPKAAESRKRRVVVALVKRAADAASVPIWNKEKLGPQFGVDRPQVRKP